MSNLKTLKDMMKTPYKAVQDFEKKFKKKPCLDCVVDVDELKQEAVKWVKEYSNEKISTPVTYKQVMKQVFSEFFNITEEDLK